MSKKSLPSKRDLDPVSVKRRTELFMEHILPHKGMIYDICIKYSREKKHIEDNYNDALVSLFRFIESYNPHKCLKSWIYIVVVRGVLESNKKNQKIRVSDNVSVESIESTESVGEVSCNCLGMDNYHEHYNDDILEALESLTPKHKEALLLQQAGYRIEEIVEIAFQKGTMKSKSTETIKSRIFLAKKQLRTMITPEGLKRRVNE